jgi:hypothetical protein
MSVNVRITLIMVDTCRELQPHIWRNMLERRGCPRNAYKCCSVLLELMHASAAGTLVRPAARGNLKRLTDRQLPQDSCQGTVNSVLSGMIALRLCTQCKYAPHLWKVRMSSASGETASGQTVCSGILRNDHSGETRLAGASTARAVLPSPSVL